MDFVERYKNDGIMNGLELDVHKEEEAVELFAENLIAAGKMFLSSPHEKPFIPCWSRVRSAMPDVYERLIEAGADEVMFMIQMGSVPQKAALETIDLIGKHVIPHFKGK